mmetsp:Transcript_4813/g.15816  ORF Transcript_4813/g.15816 Transcript_4813/m.15816 type:complete len:236 (-) Transcript_4813:2146-2853(-)|eukprot:scaffold2866_cov148-Isochrysis_galbana.AAC.3
MGQTDHTLTSGTCELPGVHPPGPPPPLLRPLPSFTPQRRGVSSQSHGQVAARRTRARHDVTPPPTANRRCAERRAASLPLSPALPLGPACSTRTLGALSASHSRPPGAEPRRLLHTGLLHSRQQTARPHRRRHHTSLLHSTAGERREHLPLRRAGPRLASIEPPAPTAPVAPPPRGWRAPIPPRSVQSRKRRHRRASRRRDSPGVRPTSVPAWRCALQRAWRRAPAQPPHPIRKA